MSNEIQDITREKILQSYNSNLKLHIKLKNGFWRNGYVTEIQPDFFIFRDDINADEPIFFLELIKVEPYMEKDKKEGIGDDNN